MNNSGQTATYGKVEAPSDQKPSVDLDLISMVEVKMNSKNTFVAFLAALQKRAGDMLVPSLVF